MGYFGLNVFVQFLLFTPFPTPIIWHLKF